MNHVEIRNKFLEFFEKKGHKVLPSYSLIPENDPSLLFVAAGMVPFKAEFSGKTTPKYKRVSTCQKCFRMDDIHNVGYTLRHHTFFEMLGNFSFGDYFKKEAIYWAYELLTEVYKIDSKKIYVSCHPEDDEAVNIWLSLDIDSDRIVRLEDNFWGPAGPTGPCGPSTEIFYENFYCANPNCKPGFECPECQKKERFIEIWNIVFTQFFKESDGKLSILPQKNIDTGMGLERLTKILQNKENQYQTDLFLPIIEFIKNSINKDVQSVYSQYRIKFDHEKYLINKDIYERIIADHIRGAVFLISDGVIPSNDGRGYVLRKLIRRALLYSRLLGINKNYLKDVALIVGQIFSEVYPELKQRLEFTKKILENEENSFNKNLQKGLAYLSEIDLKNISGKDAFYLFDTLGFPIELTIEIVNSQGYQINIDEFNKELELQKEKSRSKSTDIKIFSLKEKYSTEFVGYQNLTYESNIIGILKKENDKIVSLKEYQGNEEIILVVSQTPFYAESGGQVGDTGKIFNDKFIFNVRDTQKHIEGFVLHIGKLHEGTVSIGQKVILQVDKLRRKFIANNHTATHLLHSALRRVLGHHVYQAGSLVEANRLRFDFTHFENVTEKDIENIEDLVNEKIIEGLDVEINYKPLNLALQEGAIALFSEKYPDEVRTVKISDFSYELCGGTHVPNTSYIGNFKIISNKSIQMGVKRIEAITSIEIVNLLRKKEKIISQLENQTKQTEDQLLEYIRKKIEENRELNKKLFQLKVKFYSQQIKDLIFNKEEVLNFNIEEEDDFLIIHDLIKNKHNYIAFYNLSDRKILVFHQSFKDKVVNKLIQNLSFKLIPFGQYFKVYF